MTRANKKEEMRKDQEEDANASFVCRRTERKTVKGEGEQGSASEYLKPSGTCRLNRIMW